VRKFKSKKAAYDFVEVMACPSGCLNGGGQLKTSDQSRVAAKELLEQVSEKYQELPSNDPMQDAFVEVLFRFAFHDYVCFCSLLTLA
jgi:iron only hydrogenase large subunit-like protein